MIYIIDKEKYFKNLNFFKKNIGFVYNLDDFDSLKNLVAGRYDLTQDNFETIKNKMYNSIFNEILDNFVELGDKYFISIAADDKKIYSIACFMQKDDGHWFIDGVETYIGSRKKGFATDVLKKGLNTVSTLSCLRVDKNNKNAINLYKKLGFNDASYEQQGLEDVTPNLKLMVKSPTAMPQKQ